MMKKINTTYLIALSALVFASCSESDGLSSGIALSKEKIAFAATLQDGWNGGTSAEAGNNSRAGKPTFSGLAMEQKVLTANEGLAKPLYLHPLETENTSVMNAMPQTRGVMNESSTVGSFGVSAVYSKDGVNYSPLFQNEEATQNGSYWFTSSNATWPLDGSVSFYAYAPYNDASLSLQGSDDFVKNKTIRYTANTDFSKQPDLIVAKSESNAFTSSTANKAVGLSFNHALTAITFSISADMIPGKVKSITVSGVYGQGDYDFSNASWVSLASPSTYVIKPNDASVNAGESKGLTDKNSALMLIPQDLGADAKVSMVFNDGAIDKTVSFSLDGTSWTAGKHITYVLSSSKITTLNMGSLTYPTAWNSVNDGATYKIRTAYDDPNSSVDAGLFVVNEEKKVIGANVQLTYDGTSWSLPKGSKLKFSPKYCYFVYYPYQSDGLPDAPAKGTEATEENVASADNFFANAIEKWKSSKLAADQSTLEKMNDCDLQIGKASLDEDGCSVSFNMEHAMGLAILNRESKSVPKHYILSGYPSSYTWDNGTTTLIPSATLSNSQKLYATTNTQGVKVIPPSAASTFSSTSTENDAWSGDVNITAAANGVGTGTATIKATKVDYNYTMEVGDIYYSDGAMTHQREDLASGKTPIGIVGYIGNDYWTEKDFDISRKPVGGHALVMCLKTIGSTGSTKAAQEGKNVQAYIGTGYAWYSSNTDAGRTKINNKDLLVNSYKQSYGSGYTETAALINKWGSAAAAAYHAQNYKTLPAPSSKCTGWFLPTAGQYYAVMTNLGATFSSDWTGIWDGNTSTHPKLGFFSNMTTVTKNINDKLKKVGDSNYTEFFGSVNTWAWTSSEFSSTYAVSIDSGVNDSKGSGSVRFRNNTSAKVYQGPVRPFLAF